MRRDDVVCGVLSVMASSCTCPQSHVLLKQACFQALLDLVTKSGGPANHPSAPRNCTLHSIMRYVHCLAVRKLCKHWLPVKISAAVPLMVDKLMLCHRRTVLLLMHEHQQESHHSCDIKKLILASRHALTSAACSMRAMHGLLSGPGPVGPTDALMTVRSQ